MLSQLCLPKSTSSTIPSTSGGLRTLVTKALKRKEDKYNSRIVEAVESITGVSLRTVYKKNKWKGITLGLYVC